MLLNFILCVIFLKQLALIWYVYVDVPGRVASPQTSFGVRLTNEPQRTSAGRLPVGGFKHNGSRPFYVSECEAKVDLFLTFLIDIRTTT